MPARKDGTHPAAPVRGTVVEGAGKQTVRCPEPVDTYRSPIPGTGREGITAEQPQKATGSVHGGGAAMIRLVDRLPWRCVRPALYRHHAGVYGRRRKG